MVPVTMTHPAQTNEEDIGSFADLNASGTSFTSAPPAKRRRTKESQFEDLLTTMKKKHDFAGAARGTSIPERTGLSETGTRDNEGVPGRN
ncbi:hypothetical protein V5799_004186 [Amblyomma americanum]|uniref:Uncharacterized protein n=1 Tax=Amblyomma americanum TaxID=6943 RepID=A0AAQ4D6U2_AMBAM